MADSTAFKIQLGLVLPKLDATVNAPLTAIIEDVIVYLKKRHLRG